MNKIQILTIITALSAAIGALAQVPSRINHQHDADNGRKEPPGVVCEVPNGMAVFTNSGTWTRPPGVNRVHVKLWGGGGGGGGNWGPIATVICQGQGGLGGGGGGYCEGIVTVRGDVSVTVGGGGSAASTNNVSSLGGNGGNSSFLSLTANGGSGGWPSCMGYGGSASGGSLNVPGQTSPQPYNGGNAAFGGGVGGSASACPDGGFPGGGGSGPSFITETITTPGGGTVTETLALGLPGSGAPGLVIIYY